MRKAKRRIFIKLSTAITLAVIVMTIFSVPLISIIAPLGDIMFPGSGLWKVPGEVPDYEIIHERSLSNEDLCFK